MTPLRATTLVSACLALAGAGCGAGDPSAPPPWQRPGLIAANHRDDSCNLGADEPSSCDGESQSVVAVDTRRRRFLVVWRSNERFVKGPADERSLVRPDYPQERVLARLVSADGAFGERFTLASYTGRIDGPPRTLSASYLPAGDRYVVSWNGVDHHLRATTLMRARPDRRSHWTAANATRARDPHVTTFRRFLFGHRQDTGGQDARLPADGRRLRVYDSGYGVSARLAAVPAGDPR